MQFLTLPSDPFRKMVLEMKDTTFMPEQVAWDIGAKTPVYTYAQEAYDVEAVFEAAQAATSRDPGEEAVCVKNCKSDDPTVRYWGAMGLHVLGAEVVAKHRALLHGLLEDPEHEVRISAAEGLAMVGNKADQAKAVAALIESADMEKSGGMNAMYAFNSLQLIVKKHPGLKAAMKGKGLEAVATNDKKARRSGGYVARLKPDLLAMVGVKAVEEKTDKKSRKRK